MPPIESYTVIDGQRIDDPSGDVPPSGTQPGDASTANGTGTLAATGGEASSTATETSAPQTHETPSSGEGEGVSDLDDDLSDVDDDVATIPYVNRRIKQLNAKRRATERQIAQERQQHALELAQLRGQNEAVQRMLSGAAPALPETPAPPTGPPHAEQFERHEEFVQAAANYATDQRFQQERQRDQQQRFQQDLMSREQTFKAAHPDFDQVVRTGLAGKVSPVLQQALMLVPDGPAVAYTLAQRPEKVQELNTLPPPLVLVELGKLSPPAAAANGTTTNGATTPTPALPAPMTPLSGAGAGAPTGAYRDDMSAQEYAAWRKRTSALPAWKER